MNKWVEVSDWEIKEGYKTKEEALKKLQEAYNKGSRRGTIYLAEVVTFIEPQEEVVDLYIEEVE